MARDVRRVAVLTADVGEGHLAAARAVAHDLRAALPGCEVTTLDALGLLGRVMPILLRDAYRLQLRRAPWCFALCFRLFLRVRLLRTVGCLVLATFGARRMRAALVALSPDLVVSTYPAATSVLGTLRRRGLLDVPACATITDLAGVQFWAHRGIDLHLVMHPALVPLVEREAGPQSAHAVAPLVSDAFNSAPARSDARRALGLPQHDRIVVVSGGGWGVGDVEGAIAEAALLPGTTVVCLTGRNERLLERLAARFANDANVRVVGFTDRMHVVLAAADVLVHTTGGVTCLEALAVGCPIVAFGPPAGHAPTLARAMARLGIAAHARSRRALRAALLAPPASVAAPCTSTAVDLLLSATCRAPSAARSRHRLAPAFGVAAAATAAFLGVGSRTAFAVIADPLGIGPQSVLPTYQPDVGLVVQTSPARAIAAIRLLASHRATASFAFAGRESSTVRWSLAARHDQVIRILGGSGIDDWLGADDSDVGSAGRLVLAPAGGVSTGQYLLASLEGARMVAPGSRLRPGAVVVCTPGSLGGVLDRLAHDDLRAEPVSALESPQSRSARRSATR